MKKKPTTSDSTIIDPKFLYYNSNIAYICLSRKRTYQKMIRISPKYEYFHVLKWHGI